MQRKTSRRNSRTSKKPKLDYSIRYGTNYSSDCAKAWKQHEKLRGLCVCCLKRKAVELHHTSYPGNNLYVNFFPCCERCHTLKCHAPKNWIKNKKNPVWGNKNTPGFIKRLKAGVQILLANSYSH